MGGLYVNKEQEDQFALRLSDFTGNVLTRQQGKYARWDYCAMELDKSLIALVELKCRDKYPHDWYDGWMIDLTKWSSMIVYAECSGVGFWVANAWNDADGLYIYQPGDEKKFIKSFGGRSTNTRWAADIKPVVYIPNNRFELFNRGMGVDNAKKLHFQM